MMNVIRKKPRMAAGAQGRGEGDQGYGATAKKDTPGAQGMVVDQQNNGQQ